MPRSGDHRLRGGASLAAVAASEGVTVQRIEQIEKEALRKLRAGLEARGLSFDDLCPERPDPTEYLFWFREPRR